MTEIPRGKPRPDRTKKCTGPCAQWLPLVCFQFDSKNPDGLRNDCRACRSERRAELQVGASRCKPWKRKALAKCGGENAG